MASGYRRNAGFTVPLPLDAAMRLFTPEGERVWAGDEWDPQYPDPTRQQGPGAVFITGNGGHTGTWVMVDQESDRVRYARVSSAGFAGTIEVRGTGATAHSTTVEVTYDMTAFTDDALAAVERLAGGFESEIARWEREIAAALAKD